MKTVATVLKQKYLTADSKRFFTRYFKSTKPIKVSVAPSKTKYKDKKLNTLGKNRINK